MVSLILYSDGGVFISEHSDGMVARRPIQLSERMGIPCVLGDNGTLTSSMCLSTAITLEGTQEPFTLGGRSTLRTGYLPV